MIDVPAAFRDMPRWWNDGTRWLDTLPALVEQQMETWGLRTDGGIMHGANALVVPVRKRDRPLVLRMTPPDDAVAAEVKALRFWDGRGTVQLVSADVDAGATLLERADGTLSTSRLPLDEAVPIVARMMRRLAVPAPEGVRSTADVAGDRMADLKPAWHRFGQPFTRRVLVAALECAATLATTTSGLAVNGDLHFDQVLAADREPWLCVDPVLLHGDVEYDLARILWSRLDEMADDDEVRRHFRTIVEKAGLERERAHHWVVLRSVDYWIWGLQHRLTEDPRRCARLISPTVDLPSRARRRLVIGHRAAMSVRFPNRHRARPSA